MKRPVVLRAQADADLDSALDHCLAEAPHLADKLLSAFEATLAAIGKSPALGSPRYSHELDLPGLRHRQTRGFPYLVFYLEGASETCVLRVLHQHRHIPAELEPR